MLGKKKPINLKTGWSDKLTNQDYHNDPRISSSLIKEAKRSLRHFKLRWEFGGSEQTDAQAFGTAAHEFILQGKSDSFVVHEFKSKQTKEYKEYKKQNEGKLLLDASDFERLKRMKEAFYNHDFLNFNIPQSVIERSFFSNEESGLSVKARPDAYIDNGDSLAIFDYKTTISANPKSFQRSIVEYGYDISAAHYMEVVGRVLEKPVEEFYWIAQEKSSPYEVMIYKFDVSWRLEALAERNMVLNRIVSSFMDDYFPGYSKDIQTLTKPEWLHYENI